MNDNKSPNTSPLAGQANKPLSAPPIDVTSPAPNPVSPSPKESQNSPIAQTEIPSPAITEHEITQQASTPGEALMPSTETEPILQPTDVPPAMPSTTPSTSTTSSIPPMPSIEPPVATTVISGTSPNPAPAPITPLAPTNSVTPTIAIDSSAAIPLSTPSNSPEATTTLEPATQATTDALPPKKPKALVFIVILLALVALTLGGLVVWRAMQPKTSSIEESMTPPVVPAGEEVEQITEEEVIVEQPDETADWKVYENLEYNFSIKFPNNYRTYIQSAGAGTQEASIDARSLYISESSSSEPYLERLVDISTINLLPAAVDSFESISLTDNIQAYKLKVTDNPPFGTYYVQIPDTQDYLEIMVQTDSSRIDITNQILSTFKFTSTASSTTPGAALQGSCTQDGETYADGDEVPAPDSCNSCSCENGQIACTAMACGE